MTGRHERLLSLVAESERARDALAVALEGGQEASRRFRALLADGLPLREVLARQGDGVAWRDGVYAAMRDLEAVLLQLRGEVTRVLVDEEGLSLSEVARMSGRSRQFTTRLYRRARSA